MQLTVPRLLKAPLKQPAHARRTPLDAVADARARPASVATIRPATQSSASPSPAPFDWLRWLKPLYSPNPPLPHPEPLPQAQNRPLPNFLRYNLTGERCEFDRVRHDAARVARGTLKDVSMSYFAPATTDKPQAIALLYHGFAAGPFEFHDWTERLNAQGVTVYAARAPGHGELRAGKRAAAELPRFGQTGLYAEHAHAVMREAEDYALRHNISLYVGGFSLGGAMALDVVTSPRRKAASKLLLIAPLLRPGHLVTQRLYEGVRRVQDLPPVREFVDRVPAVGGAARNAEGPGYYPFPLHRAWSAVDYASQVHERVGRLPAGSLPPALLIGTDNDVTIDRHAGIDLVQAIGSEHRVHMFPTEAKVDHAMVGSYENPNVASLKVIEDQVLRLFRP